MDPVSHLGVIGYVLFWGLTGLAAGVFSYRLYQLFRYLSLGRKEERFGQLFRRAVTAIGHLIAQQCQFKNLTRKDRAGVGHMLVVWGFLLFITYYFFFIIIGSGFGISDVIEHSAVYGIYAWVMDIVAPLIMLGALWGIFRRFIIRSPRLEGYRTFEAMVILFTVLIHPITHLGKIATQIAAGHPPAGLGILTPPISTAFSHVYSSGASLEMWHSIWFWSHWGFVLFVLIIIGYTRYRHVIFAVLNDLLSTPPPHGIPSRINLEDESTFGVSRIDGFTRKQLLDFYACVEPGHCQEVCPAYATGKPLNPRSLIKDLKFNLLANGPLILGKKEPSLPLIAESGEGSIAEEVLWECTTCGACMEVCPVNVEHVRHIIDMRRNLVQLKTKFPDELLNLFENMEQRSNPWGIAPSERVKWASEIKAKSFSATETEFLFYVGCAGAFDARSRRTTVAVANILNAAGISWGILGKDEQCCGDSLRRLGNEYVFDRMAQENIKLFAERGVTKIITQCPHCYSTLKNDYRQYGAELEIYHHTEFIYKLIQDGKLKLSRVPDLGKLVFHDSCYLGRYNQIYEAPRQVLATATGHKPTEMDLHEKRSFCCGAGGGRMWMEESLGKRINIARVEQALEKDPQTICVCCPYCMTMFEDGLKDKNITDQVQVLDLAEITAQALK
ncbi:MAG: 4Fe-4S dicluster domain-containing protein [Dehalococcoidia bacterium]|nr:4Fe-4S dicluster domain-containing protein [Dehalococcoidia bacterium]